MPSFLFRLIQLAQSILLLAQRFVYYPRGARVTPSYNDTATLPLAVS